MRDPHEKEAILELSFYRDWVAKREKAIERDKKKATFFITISREFGCEGFELAEKLVEKINAKGGAQWTLFTRRMIEEACATETMEAKDVHEISEKRWSFKDWFVDALVPKYLQSHSSVVFQRMRNMILNLVDKGNCIILGAGSQILTQNLDPKKFHGIHIRIVASFNWRLQRTEELFKVSRGEAENLLRSRQDARDKFIADFTGLGAGDQSLYHVIFNNARNNPDTMADLIFEYMRLNGMLE
ncbi:MAG: cytidylate kinase-like family protein [Nitrospinae bacterium]|nr:cytidylate kinase-like family protein [Nitrospinota bacterium]